MSSHSVSFPWQYKGADLTALQSLGILSEQFLGNFQSVGVKLLPVPQRSHKHASCNTAPGSLAPGWGGRTWVSCSSRGEGNPRNDGVKGGGNCCPNRASIVVCSIPQGAGHRIRMCFPWVLTHQLFTRHCGSSLLCQILAPRSW